MKKLILSLIIALSFKSAIAQTWGGSTSQTGNAYRSGNTGIGTTSPNTKFQVVDGVTSVTGTGSVGIGTVSPVTKFHLVDGVASITGTNSYGGPQIVLGPAYTHNNMWAVETMTSGLNFWRPSNGQVNPGNYKFFIANNGNVSIGTDNSFGYKFSVKGNMIAEQVVVKLYGTWPDFVFSKNHSLMSLNELESFILNNSHLPDVPSEKAVQEKGIDIGEMNKILLQKIEELTLYIIDQQKQIDALKAK